MKRNYIYAGIIIAIVIFLVYQLALKIQEETVRTIIVRGTNFTLNYTITGYNKIERISVDPIVTWGIDVYLSTYNPGNLTITLPRELVDAKINGSDIPLRCYTGSEGVGGSGCKAVEKKSTSTDRTITLYFEHSGFMRLVGSYVFPNATER